MPKLHRWLMSAVAGCLFILFLLPSEPVSAYKSTASTLEVGKRYELEVNFNNLPVENFFALEKTNEAKTVVVKKGDNLAMIFKTQRFVSAANLPCQ